MKKIIFLLPVVFCLKSVAQQPYYDFKTFKEQSPIYKTPDTKPPVNTDSLQKLLDLLIEKTYTNVTGDLQFIQPNGTKVYALPNDHMPCLVPDLSQTNYNMPILMKGEKVTGMPPGSVSPYRVAPKK